MPELSVSRTGYRAGSITGDERQSPFTALRRNYQHRGTQEVLSPAEIVAELHKEIAKEHPELVAAFERKQEEKARQLLAGDGHQNVRRTSRQNRVHKYGKLRARGVSVEDAAREVGVSLSTAVEYGRDLRKAAQAGTPS